MRYFLGVYDAAGYLYKLGKGLEENGNSVRYLNLAPDRFKYSSSANYSFAKTLEEKVLGARSGSFYKRILLVFLALSRMGIFANELFRSDVFIFTGFQSFLNFHDLSVLKLFNKKIIVIYLGSDARPPYLSGKHLDDSAGVFSNRLVFKEAKKLKSRILRVERWADYIVNHVATSQFFTRKSIAFSYLGIPFDKSLINKDPFVSPSEGRTRILHAPSRPRAKGSDIFRSLVEKLTGDGYDLDFIQIKNKTNREVINEIKRADIVLDELYSDMPLATFGIEASLFKKPVIVGGYFSKAIFDFLPKDSIPPSIFVMPEDIEDRLRRLLQNKSLWGDIGERQWRFVMENYDPKIIADKVQAIITGAVSEQYIFSPLEVDYINGWGVSNSDIKIQLNSYVMENGYDALLLNHNQHLLGKIKEFCSN